MTLTPIEIEFSSILSSELLEEYPVNLQSDGPLMNPIHPRLIWAQLLFKHQLEQAEVPSLPGWSYRSFSHFFEASDYYPDISLKFVGRPWSLHAFMEGSSTMAIIDFNEWGTVALSKSEKFEPDTGKQLHHYAIPIWLSYALSPELWGPQGKWVRFDREMMKTLNERGLLKPGSTVGRYFLDLRAQSLSNLGFPGTISDDSYILELPWSFSLSSLKKLTQTIEQEF